jgi:hypothetical protein
MQHIRKLRLNVSRSVEKLLLEVSNPTKDHIYACQWVTFDTFSRFLNRMHKVIVFVFRRDSGSDQGAPDVGSARGHPRQQCQAFTNAFRRSRTIMICGWWYVKSDFQEIRRSWNQQLDFYSKWGPDATNERIAMGIKFFYETFPESRKQANRRKSVGIIHESTPGRSEAREDISSLPPACDLSVLNESRHARPV